MKDTLSDSVVSIVLVTHNDADIVERKIKDLNTIIRKIKVDYEIILIDNHSTDETIDKARALSRKVPYLRTIVLSKQYSYEIALTAGLDNCIGDYVILFNLYTDPPRLISTILEKLTHGNDVVIGRFNRSIYEQSAEIKILHTILSRVSTHGLRVNENYLTGLNRRAVNALTRTRRKSRRFEYLNSLIGLHDTSIYYTPLKKNLKKIKKENFFQSILRVIDISISNSFKPLRFVSLLGLIGSIMFMIYVVAIAVADMLFGFTLAPKGWISTGAVISSLFFVLFLMLSIISEYIIRVFAEVRNEPLYFISNEFDHSIITFNKKKKLNVRS